MDKKTRAVDEGAVMERLGTFPGAYREIAGRLHSLILQSAPGLKSTLWYGMPAYAKDGKVVCFFRADKYMTLGLTDKANHDLEAGATHQLRESAWFFTELDAATESKVGEIVRKAAAI